MCCGSLIPSPLGFIPSAEKNRYMTNVNSAFQWKLDLFSDLAVETLASYIPLPWRMHVGLSMLC